MPLNINLTDEQVISLIEQLSREKRKELLEHLQFEEWLDSSEAAELKSMAENDIKEGRTMTLEEVRKKLKQHEKDT